MNIKITSQNQKGQGLIEYILIVALVGVATMGIMSVLGNSLQKKFAAINNALGGNKESLDTRVETTDSKFYQQRNMADFMKDAVVKQGQ